MESLVSVTLVALDEALIWNAWSILMLRPSSVPCWTPTRKVEFAGVYSIESKYWLIMSAVTAVPLIVKSYRFAAVCPLSARLSGGDTIRSWVNNMSALRAVSR